jgi:hypothetical protein
MSFCPRTLKLGAPKILKLGFSRLWRPLILFADLRLRWGLKHSCSLCWELSNNMWCAICTQVNWRDSPLLAIDNQIDNLTSGPSFDHKLCFKYPNGSCKPILNICASRAFQWYKELFNPMNFDSCNCFLKIWESIGTPTPKVKAHLGVWGFIPSHSLTLPRAWNMTIQFHSWLTPL